MTLASPPHVLTAEDLLSFPDNNSMELVDGQIVEKQVSELSSKTEGRIAFIFNRFTEEHPVANVYPATMGYQCFQMLLTDLGRMRKPDVSIITMERRRAVTENNPGYMPIPPDLAVEVLSTSDVTANVNEKLREYRAAGFPLVWVVDPIDRTVTVRPNPGKPFLLSEDDTIDAPNALPGFSCKVADLFPPE